MVKDKIFFYENKIFKYYIFYSSSLKKMYLKLDKNLNIIIKANPLIDEKTIEYFLMKNIDKIILFLNKKEKSSLFNLRNNEISLLGKKYKLYIEKAFKNEKYKIYDNYIYIYLNDKENKEKIIRKILKKEAIKYIIPRALYFIGKLNLSINKISIKWLTGTWGICNSYKKIISFSSRLIVFEKEIIDYVIIHEICHLLEPNHSNKFWSLVSSFCPNYKLLKNKLKDF